MSVTALIGTELELNALSANFRIQIKFHSLFFVISEYYPNF